MIRGRPGIAVFFVTGRHADATGATWDGLFPEPQGSRFASAADKAPTRAASERIGVTILAIGGDQRSALKAATPNMASLLPNPFCLIP